MRRSGVRLLLPAPCIYRPGAQQDCDCDTSGYPRRGAPSVFCPVANHSSLMVLPVTDTQIAAPLLRVTIAPTSGNRLRKPSQVRADKVMTVKREKLAPPSGGIIPDELVEVARRVLVFLGITR